MLKDTTVIRLRQPDAIDDPLTELAREGARRMLAQALIGEADAFVALRKDLNSVTRCVADRQPGGAAMTSRNKSSSRRWRGIWSALLLLLTAFPLSRAAAQGLPLCSWPFEV